MKHTLFLCSAALLLTGCSTLFGRYERDTEQAQRTTRALYRDTTAVGGALTAADTASFGNTPWREVFTDPQLRTLIDTALVRNTDLRKALLTVKQAEIGLRINKLAYLPQIALNPSGTISHAFVDHATTNKTYTIPLQASWQIDAFGTLYNAKKQGELTLEQAKWARQATQTAIVAGVANLYYSLQMLDERLATTKSTLVLWNKNIAAMEAMKPRFRQSKRTFAKPKIRFVCCFTKHLTPSAVRHSSPTASPNRSAWGCRSRSLPIARTSPSPRQNLRNHSMAFRPHAAHSFPKSYSPRRALSPTHSAA